MSINYKTSSLQKAQYSTILRKLPGVTRFSNRQNYSGSKLFVYNKVITFKALILKLNVD